MFGLYLFVVRFGDWHKASIAEEVSLEKGKL